MQKEKTKYKTPGEWKKADPSAYATAQARGLLDTICEHFGWTKNNHTSYWNLDNCKKDALKHKTRNSWQKALRSGYWAAKRNKWLDICCKHMKPVNGPEWTLETCKESASKYKIRSEWKKGSSASYEAARKNGWIEKCCKHMKRHGNLNK